MDLLNAIRGISPKTARRVSMDMFTGFTILYSLLMVKLSIYTPGYRSSMILGCTIVTSIIGLVSAIIHTDYERTYYNIIDGLSFKFHSAALKSEFLLRLTFLAALVSFAQRNTYRLVVLGEMSIVQISPYEAKLILAGILSSVAVRVEYYRGGYRVYDSTFQHELRSRGMTTGIELSVCCLVTVYLVAAIGVLIMLSAKYDDPSAEFQKIWCALCCYTSYFITHAVYLGIVHHAIELFYVIHKHAISEEGVEGIKYDPKESEQPNEQVDKTQEDEPAVDE